jgi:inner membrane protein
LLHVGCDFLNDYGVHPLYPFDNRWFYGDSIFIIEPLWLALSLPLPALFGWHRSTRVLTRVLALGLVVLCAFVLPAARVVVVSGVMLAAGIAQWQLGARAWPVLGASLGLIGLFALGSQLTESQVRKALQRAAPDEHILDLASSPVPADPTCHRVLAVSLGADGTYRVRIARSQLFGSASACRLLPSHPTAPLTAADVASTANVRFEAVFAAPANELRALVRQHCDAAALMRFIRVPFWLDRANGTVLGDLRYDRAPVLEFAERELSGSCPGLRALSGWVPPRTDLLEHPPAQR